MPVQVKVTGDPRRPDDIVRYKRPIKKPEEGGGDLMLVVAVVIGAASLMFKYKPGAWGTVLCVLCALANIKSRDLDTKQIVSAVVFAVLSLVGSYLYVPPPPARVAVPLKT